ncbi:AAA family ATPase [Nonomuraea sp. NPDC050691]|uniref:ATP-dependent nuclease n=1 Tax=Nonomuraea sp. NPDC050691 TaxID=3155661 RepID=UPI0033C31E88
MTVEFLSEIRDSDITALREKVSRRSYGKYLHRIAIERLRGFENQEISFDFPVTALVGPNGGGKTSILGAAGLIYREVEPRRFFLKSGKYDTSMKNWRVEYEVTDKDLNPRLPVRRTASYTESKWNRNAEERRVVIFGVDRTVPASERKALSKFASGKFEAPFEIDLQQEILREVARILGKEFTDCRRLQMDREGRVSLFAAEDSSGLKYSEFHFGAGEASVIRIVSEMEQAPENSLLLIEEIENGLHPIATRKLVEYLVTIARRKSAQVIFTTHSNDALAPLPSQAIWAAVNGRLLQGKLDVKALRTLVGQVDARAAIFVEDSFAESMTRVVMRYANDLSADGIEVHGMGGWEPAISVHVQHSKNPSVGFPSICILDGDQHDRADAGKGIFAFPGDTAPEVHVISRILDVLDAEASRLALSLQLPTSMQDRVKQVIRKINATIRDRHLFFQQVGDELDYTAAQVVQDAFLAIWAQRFPEEVEYIARGIRQVLENPSWKKSAARRSS